ncbi:glycosyltransferase, partial [bacterium]|nr:glycosyltransferase [bacterium]
MSVLLLGSKSTSSWGSCQKISANLKASYVHAAESEPQGFFEILLLDPKEFFKPSQISSDLFSEMVERGTRKVVFVDHSPHPKNFIFALKEQREELYNNLEFVFHVYGDFTLLAKDWYELFLDGSIKATFICSSMKQKKMVESFLFDSDSEANVLVIPFPVCSKDHFFDMDLRQSMRARLGLAKDSFVVLYSGRLSLQKNILFIIEEFSKFFESCSVPPTLLLAGDVDDLVSPMCEGRLPLGAHFYLLRRAWLKCPEPVRKNILFLGNVPNSEINGIYCASDLLFSPSLYHDEDYGMSVAESLMTGLPCLITDWGGYSSFHQLKLNTDLI